MWIITYWDRLFYPQIKDSCQLNLLMSCLMRSGICTFGKSASLSKCCCYRGWGHRIQSNHFDPRIISLIRVLAFLKTLCGSVSGNCCSLHRNILTVTVFSFYAVVLFCFVFLNKPDVAIIEIKQLKSSLAVSKRGSSQGQIRAGRDRVRRGARRRNMNQPVGRVHVL